MAGLSSVFVRFFYSAVDPADSDEVRRMFVEDIKPAFEELGCESVELLVSTETNAGGLVEGLVISRWPSTAAMDKALGSRAVTESLVRVRQLLRQEPVTRTFEVLE
ncbi:MAG: antibiotic biosynthesis monooxygenase family protein [Acidimicrobiia bacterium]